MRHIASRDNPHFKALRKLARSGRERRKSGLAWLDGMHLIEAYGQHVGRPEEVLVSESGSRRAEIARYLESGKAGEAITIVADALFDDLALVETPTGIMAVIMPPRCARGPDPAIDSVLLDGIQDAGNLGSVLRSTAAAGFRQILLSTDCAQPWSPKTLRAAMGAHFRLDIHESCDLPAFLASYSGQAVLTTIDASASLYSLDLQQPVAWVFGSEGQGVRPDVAAWVSLRIRIPMPGATESLNVAAAAAVCLFETVRQRQTAKP